MIRKGQACCSEDRARVILEEAQPRCHVRSVVGPRMMGDTEIGQHEGSAQFCGCFLDGQPVTAEPLPRLASQERKPPNQPENMVWIPGGEFWMGGPSKSQSIQAANEVRPGLTVCRGLAEGFSDAEPQVRVHVDGFWMDRTVWKEEGETAFGLDGEKVFSPEKVLTRKNSKAVTLVV
jgi:formylglycine-generating enzyme required for sulfatase activity